MVKEKPLEDNDGLIKSKRIAIRKDIPTLKGKSCVLAEELGHYYTTFGDIIEQNNTMAIKQEYHARLWAYNTHIGLLGLVRAYENGCQNSYEAADFLGVTEEFLADTIDRYKSKYGIYADIDEYIF